MLSVRVHLSSAENQKGDYRYSAMFCWEPEGRYRYSTMFCWEPEGRYRYSTMFCWEQEGRYRYSTMFCWEQKGHYRYSTMFCWEQEGRYRYSTMFCGEPEVCFHHRLCTEKAPFWFSMEHCWIVIMPFWLSTDDIHVTLNERCNLYVFRSRFCTCWYYGIRAMFCVVWLIAYWCATGGGGGGGGGVGGGRVVTQLQRSCCGSVDKTTDCRSWGPQFKSAGSGSSVLGQGTLSSLPSPLERT